MAGKPTYEELETRIRDLEKSLSDLKAEEETLKKNEAYLRTLIRTIPDLVWMKDDKGVFISCNSRFERFFGAREEDIIGKTDYDFVNKELADFFRRHDKEAIAKGQPSKNEEEVVFSDDGHREILETIKTPIYQRDGRILGVLGIGRDITAYKKAEEEIRETKERLQSFMDSATDSMSIYDSEFRFLDINTKGLSFLGPDIKKEYVTGRYILDVVPQLESSSIFRNYERVLKTGEPSFSWDMTEINGIKIWYNLKIFKVGYGLGIIASDITAQKEAEEEIRETKERLQLFMDSATDSISMYDAEFRLVDINDKVVSFFPPGTEKKDLIGKHILELLIPHKRENAYEQYKRVMQTGEPYFSENVFGTGDDKRWMNIRAFKVGNGVGIMTTDVTAQKGAEEKIKEIKERLQSFMDSATDIMSVYDANFNLIETNAATFKYLPGGIKKEDVLGMNLMETSAFFGTENAIPAFKKVIETGEPEFYEEALTVNQKKVWFNARVFKVGDGVGVILNDTTERKKLEDQLHQAQKIESIGRLAGGIAHDFNNMLGIIIGYTDIALHKANPDEKISSYLNSVMKAANRSADLTHQLLAFARKQTISPRVLDLNETLSGMLKMLRALIGENIELVWRPADEVWSISIDPSQVDQILANLCVNARDAIADTGRITIETKNIILDENYCSYHSDCVPGEFVMLSVTDNGKGMDRETRENIFEPFFTTKGIGKGTGLGLATVYGIVKQNNGSINVYSEPGVGTSFKLFFPRQIPGEKEGKRNDIKVTLAEGNETVLLVEDEPVILEMTKLMLEQLGYTVLAVSKAEEALRIAKERKENIQLLISDVIMPDMNGRVLAENINAIQPGVKCLFMSGYTDNVIAHHGVLEHGVYFIQKPFSTQVLAGKVREALDG